MYIQVAFDKGILYVCKIDKESHSMSSSRMHVLLTCTITFIFGHMSIGPHMPAYPKFIRILAIYIMCSLVFWLLCIPMETLNFDHLLQIL